MIYPPKIEQHQLKFIWFHLSLLVLPSTISVLMRFDISQIRQSRYIPTGAGCNRLESPSLGKF